MDLKDEMIEMKKAFLIALTLGGLTSCLGFIANQQPADAAAWQVIKTKDYTHSRSALSTPYYVNKKGNVYMWNLHHTKRLHNLKNYPRTNFMLRQSVVLKHGSKYSMFYRVISSGKANGYVYRGYLTKGWNPARSLNNSAELEQQLINQLPGLESDQQLQSLANAYGKNITGDDFDEYSNMLDRVLGPQHKLVIFDDQSVNPLLQNPQNYGPYVKAAITNALQTKLGKSINDLQNWRMGIYAYPYSSSYYGSGALILMPPKN